MSKSPRGAQGYFDEIAHITSQGRSASCCLGHGAVCLQSLTVGHQRPASGPPDNPSVGPPAPAS